MTEETFRLWVTVAAVAVVIIFLVNVIAWAILAYVSLSIRRMISDTLEKINPAIPKLTATLDDVQKTVARITTTTNELTTEVRAVSAAVSTSAERVSVIATESAEEIRALVLSTSHDIKTMVSSTSSEITDLVNQSSGQVRSVMASSTSTAQNSLDRLDLAVERTVVRFEDTGEFVQESVLGPIREVAAIVTAIKVALETLMGYPQRKQIDQAYQDEELLI